MKKLLTILMLGIFFISFVSSTCLEDINCLGIVKQNENMTVKQTCNDATYVTISSISYPNSTEVVKNINMSSTGSGRFAYNVTRTNTLGRYTLDGISDGCDLTFGGLYFIVNITGEDFNLVEVIAYIFLMLFFMSLMAIFYIVSTRVDYDKWHISILKKCEGKNAPKAIVSGMLYSLAKESFMTYYLLSFPVMILLMRIIDMAAITYLVEVMDYTIILYFIGLLIVGFLFFGKLQEFIMKTIDQANDVLWGIK